MGQKRLWLYSIKFYFPVFQEEGFFKTKFHCPRTYYVDQANLKFMEVCLPACDSQVLAHTTMPGFIIHFKNKTWVILPISID